MSKPDTTDMEVEDQLDLIIDYLHKMNRRDKARTIGGFFRSLIMMIPVALVVLSAYIIYNDFDGFLDKISAKAAQAAVGAAQSNTKAPELPEGFMEQFESLLPMMK